MSAIAYDFLQSCRLLRRNLGISAVIVITIAFGIGTSLALATLFNALVVRPLPVVRPQQLVAVSQVGRTGQARGIQVSLLPEVRRQELFQALCAYSGGALMTTDIGGESFSSLTEFVSGEYYEQVLGVRPFLGRLIAPADAPTADEAAKVVVLGYAFWEQAFGGDRAVIGRSIRVQGLDLTIIGVAPPGFTGLRVERGPDITVPIPLLTQMASGPPGRRIARATHLVGRVRAGMEIEAVRAKLAGTWPHILAATPASDLDARDRSELSTRRVEIESIATGFSTLRARHSMTLLGLLGFTAILLLLVCANVGGLLLVRAGARQSERQVRLALGASRGRLLIQSVMDGWVLACVGALLALPFAWWGAQALGHLLWSSTAMSAATFRVALDWRILLLMAGLVMAVGLTIGLLPTLGLHRRALGQQARGATRRTRVWSGALASIQIALSLTFLFAAALLGASVMRLQATDVGVGVDGVSLLVLQPRANGYRHVDRATYYPLLAERLAALPGVRAVGFSRLFPTTTDASGLLTTVATTTAASSATEVSAPMEVVSPDFFRAVAIPVDDGRPFTWQDDGRAVPVAVVNAALARKLFPSGRAVGQFIRIGNDAVRASVQIVGVVGNSTLGNPRESALPIVFRPWAQEPEWGRYPTVSLRATGEHPALVREARQAIASLGNEHVRGHRTLREQFDGLIVRERLLAILAGIFGIVALLLCCLNLYAIMAYTAVQRTREVGVRLALGATRVDVLLLIMKDAWRITLVGTLLGVPAALAVGAVLRGLLFGMAPFQPVPLLAAILLAIVVASLGAAMPARRAARLAPSLALRQD